MTERDEITQSGRKLVDLTKPGSPLLNGLTQPVRVVTYSIGSFDYRVPRGADDPTPDNVVKMGGLYFNTSDGRVSKDISQVV